MVSIKKILDNTKFLSMVLIVAVVVCIAVIIQIVSASQDIASLENELSNYQTVTLSDNEKDDNSAESSTQSSEQLLQEQLQEQLNDAISEYNENQEAINELDTFCSEYCDACTYIPIGAYTKKQENIYNRVHPYFTESAWKTTDYYETCNWEENTKLIETGTKILVRSYYSDITDNSAQVFLIERDSEDTKANYMWEILTLTKIDGDWKISEYYHKNQVS